MADRQRTIEAKLKISQEGDVSVIKETAHGLDEIDAASKGAEKALGQLTDTLERGFGASDKQLTRTKLSLDEYRQAIEAAEKAGATIGDEERRKLQLLEGAYDGAIRKTAEFREEQARVQTSVRLAQGDINQLARGIDQLSSQTELGTKSVAGLGSVLQGLGGKAAAVAGPLAAIVAAWEVAEKVSGGLATGLNKLEQAMGGAGNSFKNVGPILVWQDGINGVARAVVDLRGELDALLGKEEASRQKQTQVREAYLAAHDALVKKTEATKTSTAATEIYASATMKAAAATEAQTKAEEQAVDLEGARADALNRTNAELAANAEAQQKAAEAFKPEDLQKTIDAIKAANDAYRELNKTLGQVEAGANDAAAALAKAAAAAGHDPFGNPTSHGYGVPSGSQFPGETGTGAYSPSDGGG